MHISPIKTGVTLAVSEQKLLGVAADMAKTGVQAWLNPMRLLGELDDIARNVRWLGLRSEIWQESRDKPVALSQGHYLLSPL